MENSVRSVVAPKTPSGGGTAVPTTACVQRECTSCSRHATIAVLACMGVIASIVCLVLIVILCRYFGVRYFLRGGYHYDSKGETLDRLLPPPNANNPKENPEAYAHAMLTVIRVTTNIPKALEDGRPLEEQCGLPAFPKYMDMEPIFGTDGKVYAAIFHFSDRRATVIACINLRYLKQWRCFFDTKLTDPFYLDDAHSSSKFSTTSTGQPKRNLRDGKIWSCINHFYKLFRGALLEAWEERFKHRSDHLYIVGHSLGGATAPIIAHDFRVNHGRNDRNTSVFISGAPRCGDDTFKCNFDVLIPNCWNSINTYDVICLTPPLYDSSHRYEHIGTPIFFSVAHPDGLASSHMLKTYLDHFAKSTETPHQFLADDEDDQ